MKTLILSIIALSLQGADFVTGYTASSTVRNNFSGQLGYIFTVGSSSVTVTALGRWCSSGNSGTHTVTINDTSNTVLATASVNMSGCTTGTFVSTTITNYVLSASTQYAIVSNEVSGQSDNWYDSDGTLTTTSVATINAAVYGPLTQTGSTNNGFIPVNFSYLSYQPAVKVTQSGAATPPSGMSFDGTVFTAGDEHRFNATIPGRGPQSINRGVSMFNGAGDPVLSVGYNQRFNGTVIEPGEPGLVWNIEGNYDDGTGHNKMEAYLQYVSDDGTVVIRPFMFQIDRVRKKLIGSLLNGDPVNLNSAETGEPLAQFWRNGTILFKPTTVNALIAAKVIQSLPQSEDPGCDFGSAGKIWFDDTDIKNTIERHCLIIDGTPTWSVK